jgi:hypothetical protein
VYVPSEAVADIREGEIHLSLDGTQAAALESLD